MENRIALLIDCDNISFKMIDAVIKEVEQYGDVIIKRAYGNWQNEALKNWVGKLTELSIKPIHQIDYTKGKNATDMAIVIDAMDLMHLKKCNAFAIVSSDSDFTPLTMKLSEEGYKVYGFGNKHAPISLKNSCSIFTDISGLQHNFPEKVKPVEKESKNELRETVLKIFNDFSPNNQDVSMEKFNQLIKVHKIDFKNYGFKQLKVFIDSLNLFQIHINEKSQGFVKLKAVNITDAKTRLSKQELLKNTNLINQLTNTYKALVDERKEVNLSTYFNYLALKHGFSHKNYGYSTLKDFMTEIDMFNFVSIEDQYYIVLK
jgi:uncharacterized protein (TIGR00288 family)